MTTEYFVGPFEHSTKGFAPCTVQQRVACFAQIPVHTQSSERLLGDMLFRRCLWTTMGRGSVINAVGKKMRKTSEQQRGSKGIADVVNDEDGRGCKSVLRRRDDWHAVGQHRPALLCASRRLGSDCSTGHPDAPNRCNQQQRDGHLSLQASPTTIWLFSCGSPGMIAHVFACSQSVEARRTSPARGT